MPQRQTDSGGPLAPSTPPDRVPQNVKDKWAGQNCTLDGQPARVQGRLRRFAFIACELPAGKTWGFLPAVEFAWPTVDRIMREGGAFRS